jgi:uncharacterized protein (TIGR03437 family)
MVLYCTRGQGQAPPTTILEVDVENLVSYFEDTSDLSKFATDPNVTAAVPPRNFNFNVAIGDIVAVNGQPAKGTYTRNIRVIQLNTAPTPGQAIADTVRPAAFAETYEILKSDGSPIGTIVSYGLAGGSPPPGLPLSVTQGNFALTGGTGAFLGARGQSGQAVIPQTIAQRVASVTEDPGNRRRNGGGRVRFVLQVIPMFRPEVEQTVVGPTVTHSNGVLVTASRPAKPGETLSLFATGLGPTRPGVNPGEPFPDTPLAVVNSPVEVTVNGIPAEVLSAFGVPGEVERYQVNFRLPPETARRPAMVQITAAWITGSAARIVVR